MSTVSLLRFEWRRANVVLAGLLVVGALAIPLVFTIELSDVFALPKTATVLVLTAILLPGLLVMGVRWGVFAVGNWSVATVALVAYLVLTTAATLHSADPTQSVFGERLQYQGLLATLAYLVAFVAARTALSSERRIRALAIAVVAAATVASLYGLAQQVGLDPIWHVLDRGRIFSTLGQANALAAYLVLALPLAVVFGLTVVGRMQRLALLGAGGVIAIALALTLSRGGYLGALVAMSVMGALLFRRSMLTRRRLGLVGAAVFVVGMVSFSPLVAPSLNRIVQRASMTIDLAEGSAASHLDLWAVGVRMATDYPVLGTGPEMYPVLFSQYRDRVLPPGQAAIMARFRPESPHDVPIAIAAGAGLPALLAYLMIVLGALAAGWRWMRAERSRTERLLLAGLLAAALGHVTTDLFMTAEVAGTFWVLLGILAAGKRGQPRWEGAMPIAPRVHLG
jgi:O-antigen ligase